MHTAKTTPRASQEAHTTAGLLLSLANALPEPTGALGRSASVLAHRMASERPSPALEAAAADMLARLLDAVDLEPGNFEPDVLDTDFDA